MAVKGKPLADRVLVKPLEEKETKKGGIIIPDSAKERPVEGEIVSTGPGKVGDDGKLIPMTLKKGDRVLYGKYAGTEIKLNGDEFLLMREDDVLMLIEK
jgi:chaperonin GroES